MALDLSDQSVLIVDDEKFSRSIVAHLLGEMGKPRITHADNGSEALDALGDESVHFDFVIADFNMPVMNGLQLLKSIRVGHRDIDRAMPVAMVTGYSEKHLVDLALALDINAFLIKPVSKRGLEKRLESMLNQVGEDIWLKSESLYHDLNVDEVLDEVLGSMPKPSGEETPRSRRFFIKGKEGPLLDGPEPGSADGSEAQPPAGMPGGEAAADGDPESYKCPLRQIPPGSILARDVHTADGRLFMHAGAEMTLRIISILLDLLDLDHPVDSIWIVR